MKKFGKGIPAWHACRKNEFGKRGEQNEQACKDYCKSNPSCVRCTPKNCGKGKDWRACQKTHWAENTEKAHAEAVKWCREYKQKSGEDCRIVKSGQSCSPWPFYEPV